VRRFVAVWTLKRGVLANPEELDPANEYVANLRAAADYELDCETLRERATRGFRLERDPQLTEAEILQALGRIHGNSREARLLDGKGA
jgi:hypothetical protein